MLVADALAVALEEAGEQLRHQRLGEHGSLVQPRRGAELRVGEHGRVQPRERAASPGAPARRCSPRSGRPAWPGRRSSSRIVNEPSSARSRRSGSPPAARRCAARARGRSAPRARRCRAPPRWRGCVSSVEARLQHDARRARRRGRVVDAARGWSRSSARCPTGSASNGLDRPAAERVRRATPASARRAASGRGSAPAPALSHHTASLRACVAHMTASSSHSSGMPRRACSPLLSKE